MHFFQRVKEEEEEPFTRRVTRAPPLANLNTSGENMLTGIQDVLLFYSMLLLKDLGGGGGGHI